MKGLELSKAYFEEYGKKLINEEFSEWTPYMAFGLVGEGSECLGFDDEISRDHDFGPGFCIWLPEKIYDEIGEELQRAYSMLPKAFNGYTRNEMPEAGQRVGVMTIEGFYREFTGQPFGPQNNLEWIRIPESFLAVATNGKVFCDNEGTFSKVRDKLIRFYPEDVRCKKLAARAAVAAQSGQYNYSRCVKRGEYGAAYLACGEFIKAVISIIHLLNKSYTPFYKWAFRSAEQLSKMNEVILMLKELVKLSDMEQTAKMKIDIIEDICISIGKEFNAQMLSQTKDAYLMKHAEEIMQRISDQQISQLHIMYDC